ncbi:YeiH family protein [Jannaschia marina]|uniref:YeiH family protein n=1 Tax=Jannaschia marina TaxID=2741674 RepID=UPI0015CD37B7|nr:putative sulfate exporter family transporter [Jannaschia marina]
MVALPSADALRARVGTLAPGVLVAVIVAVAAQFLASHYDTPAMLLALLLGIAVAFLGSEGKTPPGIAFTARTLLRLGVALLGVRISFSMLAGLGLPLIALTVGGVLATIAFGMAVGRFFGHKWRFSLLTAGSVAICGASAAMAISAILPKDERSEERLIFTVMGVTILSTVAMIAYPVLVQTLGLDDVAGGVFLGGTIHDVAQVVGAGYSVSEPTGDTATLVKLIRVAMLAPVVLVASLAIRRWAEPDPDGTRPPLLPGFVVAFLVLAAANSLGLIPAPIASFASDASRWLLLTAIAAVGMKTDLRSVMSVGGAAIALIIAETIFIAALVLAGVKLMT